MSVLSELGIENFYQKAVQQGFARDYQFRVLKFGNWIADPSDLLYITTATMPGRTITAIGVPFMGLNFQVPGAANYNSNAGWSVTFRCDETLKLRNLLEDWSYGIFNDITSKGSNIPNPSAVHEVDLLSLDNLGNPRKRIKLVGAFVTNTGDISYNITGNGAVVTMNATLAYQYWRNIGTSSTAAPAQPGDASVSAAD